MSTLAIQLNNYSTFAIHLTTYDIHRLKDMSRL